MKPLDKYWGFRPLFPTHELNTIFDGLNFDTIKTNYPTNYYIEDGSHVIEHALAGFSKDEITIDVDKNKVNVEARRNKDKADTDALRKYCKRGISTSTFKVSWEIPSNLDASKTKAEYTDGILRITIPETQESKDSKFKVNIS